MTERLYYVDSRLVTFEAEVVSASADGRRIYLDRSAFYPTSGGQPRDGGTLGGRAVVDVVDEDDHVAHVLAEPMARASVGDRVQGTIDWSRRFDHMQQHTGQHLLTATFARLQGSETLSVHFGDDYATLDLDTPSITAGDLADAELEANRAIAENHPVHVTFEDAEKAEGLRKASERTGTLRIVTIETLDHSACGGTHVRATGEIGVILLRRTERVRQATRVEFVCGLRAVRQARRDQLTLAGIAQTLGTSAGEAAEVVASQASQLREAIGARRRMEGELAAFQARTLYDATLPDETGVRRHVVHCGAGATLEQVKPLAQAYAALPRSLFVATVSSPPSVLVTAASDASFDAGLRLKAALQAAGGRGGGSPSLAQGTVPDAAGLERVLQALSA